MNLSLFNTPTLFEASTNLFQQLGIKLNSNTAEALPTKDLLKSFYKDNEVFNSIKSTYFIGIIDDSVFQATGMFDVNYSIKEALQQGDKNYDGLMLFALELSKKPTRTEISEITRAFNRISQKMPVALVLKYSIENVAVISIAISERFKYLQNWWHGEKAGKIIILRDIHTKPENTHAGHQRILLDLVKLAGVTNYEQLLAQWLDVLDVNILNKKFFQELANWYFWAMDNVRFPDDIEKKKDVRNATNLIRLITRVIFIWFIKEKHLVPASLFNEKYLSTILKDFQKNKKSGNYYQAILQNLFFGTLNQKMDERDFAEDHNRTNKLDQGIKNKYRYSDKFNITKKEIIDLFKDIPFLNGGLFDCLDKFDEEKLEKGKKEQIFVDGFTRLDGKQAIVPDYLFFGVYPDVDLTEYYDPEAKKPIVKNVKGLIDILNNFKFTVAENTPIEEEIALDPELLGKVFENLLASYNPETKTTARKQTGSFYTPREIVNYMVDESLIEYLKSTVSIPAHGFNQKQDAFETFETFFNPHNEIHIHTGNLPHWQQENVWYFVTFRLADSIPAKVAEQIKSEREIWLKNNQKNKNGEYSKEQLKEYYHLFSERIETLLVAGKGSCVLKDEKIAKIVSDALRHFNNKRYVLDEWVIMPNHVHILFKPLVEYQLLDILHSWKSFTANRINEQLGKKGQFWMHESYDHIVRNESAFNAIRNYIWQNPVKANLMEGEYVLSNGSKDASGTFDSRLRSLFSYNDEGNPLNSKETDELIEAINNAKILDPACGSGAFPMGVLHKMVHLLQKLDPSNVKWKAQQKEKIIGDQIKELEKDKKAIASLSDKAVREKAIQAVDERLNEIDEIFESKNNFDDYARKLYLIENCIYGIDIQPIAVQISKLRFFISLIIDQDKDSKKENLGYRSLPNLETKFVAANTLIGLEKPKLVTGDIFIQDTLNHIKEKSDQLKQIRHKYFNAKLRKEKLQLQAEDKKLRKEISESLVKIGHTKGNAYNIASFDPYDQNHYANWFDPEWMFGLLPQNNPESPIITLLNLQIEATNQQIKAINIALKQSKIKIELIVKLQFKTANNQLDIIKKELDIINKNIENIYGSIEDKIDSIVGEPIDYLYQINMLNNKINEINNLIYELAKILNPATDGNSGVFNIVIGNPPYVVTKKGTYSNYKWEGDLYTIFFELSVKILLKQKGILSFITPRFFLFNQINFEMRKYILNELNILLMAECNPFDAVTENEITVLTVEKAKSSKIDFFTHQNEAMQFLNSVNKDWIKTNKLLEINPYLTEKIFFVLQKIKGNNKILSEFSISKRGAEIGKNDLRAVLKGKSILLGYDVNRFCITPTDAKIDTGHKEYQRLINIFKHPQLLLLRRVSKDLIAAVTDNPIAFSKNLYGIILNKNINPHFLSALLNSKLLNFYYKKKFSTKKEDVFPEIQTYLYEQLPIKNANEKEQRLVVNIVDQILTAKKSNPHTDTSKLERQIDELVYKLYDLTEEEIAIIENKQ